MEVDWNRGTAEYDLIVMAHMNDDNTKIFAAERLLVVKDNT